MVQDTVSFADTTNNISGNANLLYSKCAIIKALTRPDRARCCAHGGGHSSIKVA